MRAKMPSIRSMLLFLAGCRPGPGHREVGRADCAPYLAAAAYMIPSIMRSRAGPAKRKIAPSGRVIFRHVASVVTLPASRWARAARMTFGAAAGLTGSQPQN
jgi:hypothetical protein